MAHLLHDYVLSLALIPALAPPMFLQGKLTRLLLVEAEVKVLKEQREKDRDAKRARVAEQHETYLMAHRAHASGDVYFKVRRVLNEAVEARYAAD